MVSIHGARTSPDIFHVLLMYLIFLIFNFIFFFVEKPSTALWTRALLLKRRCQHTTTRCWARTTRKTTSLSAKQVRSAAAVFAEVLLLFWHPSSSTSQNQPPSACLEGSPNLPFFPCISNWNGLLGFKVRHKNQQSATRGLKRAPKISSGKKKKRYQKLFYEVFEPFSCGWMESGTSLN